jgi:hypothetical protein
MPKKYRKFAISMVVRRLFSLPLPVPGGGDNIKFGEVEIQDAGAASNLRWGGIQWPYSSTTS